MKVLTARQFNSRLFGPEIGWPGDWQCSS
jgi:hypothetical protein